jgi:TRAP-type uncharacterized transport system fused permease subunit
MALCARAAVVHSGDIVMSFVTASAGVVLLGIACAGFFTRPLGWSRRLWAIAAAALLIMPPLPHVSELAADGAGLLLGALLLMLEWSASPRRIAHRATLVPSPSTTRTEP